VRSLSLKTWVMRMKASLGKTCSKEANEKDSKISSEVADIARAAHTDSGAADFMHKIHRSGMNQH
jgi:hypothetical protein